MARVKIGCGWYVLAVLGLGIWAANKWAPRHIARAKAAVSEKLPELPWSRRAAPPSPPPPTPSPEPTVDSATPAPEAVQTEAVQTEAVHTGAVQTGAVQTEDVRPGTGRSATLGQTVRIRCTRLGEGGESLGGSSDFLFMLGAEEVAPGLDRAVLGMKAGGKRRTTIPAEDAKGLLPPGVEAEGGALSCEIELAEVL